MIAVTGTFQIGDGDIEEAKAVAIAMMKETEKEDGCICYRFYQDLEKPDMFRVYEEWESEDALKAHFNAPHMAVFREALGKINLISRDVKKMEIASVSAL